MSLADIDTLFFGSTAAKINAIRQGWHFMPDGRLLRFGTPDDATPVRLKPGVPPVRDAAHRRAHRQRKAARAARRRNRA